MSREQGMVVGTKLLTAGDLAEVLRTTPKAVYALVKRGHLPPSCIFRVGRLLRFRANEVQSWIDQGSHGGKDKSP